MPPTTALFCLALAIASPAFANPGEVELNYRLRPDSDLTTQVVADSITTMRVLEDRGIVAKTNGRFSSQPTTFQVTGRQSFRTITGKAQPDGSFSVEMHYLDKTTHLKGPDGKQHLLPETTPLKGLRVLATVEPGGKVREGSVALSGPERATAGPLGQMMASLLTQAASIEPIWLARDRSVPQDVTMQVPVPGITTLNLTMRISNRLLSVDGGVARIQQVYSMDFGNPDGALKMTAEGSGGGTMLYEVATRTLLSSDTGTLMKITFDAPDGVVQVQMDGKQTQTMRPTPAQAR